jgi:hypothetical protein
MLKSMLEIIKKHKWRLVSLLAMAVLVGVGAGFETSSARAGAGTGALVAVGFGAIWALTIFLRTANTRPAWGLAALAGLIAFGLVRTWSLSGTAGVWLVVERGLVLVLVVLFLRLVSIVVARGTRKEGEGNG